MNFRAFRVNQRGRNMQVLLLLVLAVSACADNPPVVYPTTVKLDENQLALGPADKLALTIFWGSHRDDATYTLDSSGRFAVQYIGDVDAAGKTVSMVKDEIQRRLADGYLKDPIVALSLVEINSLKLSVFGQVLKSGTIKFTFGMTITEAIAQSGGFSPLARKNMVKVTRTVDGKKMTYKVPVEMIGDGKRPNFPMLPGDEVFVPERPW